MASMMSIAAFHPPASSRTPEPSEMKRIPKSPCPTGPPSSAIRKNSRYYKDGPATLNDLRVNLLQKKSANIESPRIGLDDKASISSTSTMRRRSTLSQSSVCCHSLNRISIDRSQPEAFRQGEHDYIPDSLEIEPVNAGQPRRVNGGVVQRGSGQEVLTAKFKIEDYGAPPLNKIHFSCYQFHRSFIPSDNFNYPLQCMTCLKSDLEIRWRCTFCCLRVCSDCVAGIKKCKDRSLIGFMERLVQSLEAA